VDLNIPVQKSGALQMGPKEQSGDFLEIGSNNIDHTSVIYADHIESRNGSGGITV
jgi:hypothetical protein